MNYRIEWIPGPILLGALLLPVIAPPFALIGLVVIAVAAVAVLVAAAGALLATPYLLVRFLRRRHTERERATEGSRRVAPVIAPAVANPTTARS